MGVWAGYEVIARSKATGKIVKRSKFKSLKASKVKKRQLQRLKSIGKVVIRDLS